ncbi:glycosyltransferase family 4 protein [Candidatus Woesearchaeota archaeon]|nr:glycosyltransferase family 4 protein [Candidatus Woesearchaeota archaeon]
MKLMILAHNPMIPTKHSMPGGGEISMRELSEYLTAQGHEIEVLQFSWQNQKRTLNGVHYYTLKATSNKRKLALATSFAKKHRPECLLTWSFESKIALNLKRELGIPYVFFVHRFETLIGGYWRLFRKFERLLPSLKNSQFRGKKNTLKIPLRVGYAWLMDTFVYGCTIPESFREADLVVANSEYTRRMIQKIIGVDAIVSYYRIRAHKYRVKSTGSYITAIGLGKKSGHRMMEALARSMPDHKFLSVGHKDEVDIPNLKVQRTYVDDPRDIYRQTRIFISAREHPEAFGRVPVEAMLSGIPAIATDLGGHAESVDGGGILMKPSATVKDWKKAILQIEKEYKNYSKKARTHAKKFDSEAPKKELEKRLTRIIAES